MLGMSASSVQSEMALPGLAQALVQADRLAYEDAVSILRRAPRRQFAATLVADGRLTALELAEFAAETFGLPLLDLDAVEAAALPIDAIDQRLIQSARVLPLKRRKNRLAIATADPTDTEALDQVKFQTGLAIEPVVVEDTKLALMIARLITPTEPLLGEPGTELGLEVEPLAEAFEMSADDEPESDADDAPVVRFVRKVLGDAVNEGASDVHFEPYERSYRVRMRVDGVLHEVAQPPYAYKERIASRLKIISRMDIAEKRVPQDGRFKLRNAMGRSTEFRVSSLPTVHGEKIVLRLLEAASSLKPIETLGYEPEQLALITAAIERPYGMVLVTGPTGSGKTLSLYSFLNRLNRPGVNISTAEDPAEITIEGINQVNLNERAGLTFAAALRAFLRQDPDIVMVGEIRDTETAEIAVKAAQTGHLVLSTLHTNDAPSTLTRLAQMGVPAFNIASAVILITAQRLARRLCGCKAPVNVPDGALIAAGFTADDLDGRWRPLGPVGCDHCKGTGFKGRIGIYQVMPISDAMSRLIVDGGNTIAIAELAAREGVATLRQSGLRKVRQGITSLEEVIAVTNE